MAEKRPFRIVLGEAPPKGELGGSLKGYVPPGAQYHYKPQSVFARYRALSLVFALLVLALLIYWFVGPLHGRRPPAPVPPPAAQPPAEPVYVVPVPAKPHP